MRKIKVQDLLPTLDSFKVMSPVLSIQKPTYDKIVNYETFQSDSED